MYFFIKKCRSYQKLLKPYCPHTKRDAVWGGERHSWWPKLAVLKEGVDALAGGVGWEKKSPHAVCGDWIMM